MRSGPRGRLLASATREAAAAWAAAWAARAAEESGRGVVRLSLVLRRGVERERE